MKLIKNKKTLVLSSIVIATMLFLGIVSMAIPRTSSPPALEMGSLYSAMVTNTDDLTFTSFENTKGEQEYKVGIKVASRATAEFIVIPDTYNGIPVTQIADGGFLSCSKLEKVILPLSLEKVGMNAFMNCSKLKRVTMPRVKSIGNNAFGMCNSLERLFIPETVTEVGATILRNNPNTVYVQNSVSEISGWNSTWHDYATGNVEFEATPSGLLQYQEILNENDEVIAYELTEGQFLANADYDMTIYSSYSPDPENVAFKPVVNINSQAFTLSQLKSLTIKHRHMDDATADIFNHTINIRSEAFAFSFMESINLEVNVEFNHPTDVTGSSYESYFDGHTIQEDVLQKSTNVFYESSITSITLPNSLDLITEGMFHNSQLEEIRIAGTTYTGTNYLPNVQRIGSYAFNTCVNLENIVVPSTVETAGEYIFFDWGYGSNNQTIAIDMYDDEVPVNLNRANLEAVSNAAKVTITYKQPITITLNLQDGTSNTTEIYVKPGQALPSITMPTRTGYIFKGFFSGPNAAGLQYYTADAEPVRTWSEGNNPILYASWERKVYTVTLNTGFSTSVIYPEFDMPMPASTKPQRVGYEFGGYFCLESNGTQTYYYNANMGSVRNWNRDANTTLHAVWNPITYTVSYNGNTHTSGSTASSTHTYDSYKNLTANGFEKTGYLFAGWAETANGPVVYSNGQSVVNLSSTKNATISLYAKWTAITYQVSYNSNKPSSASGSISGSMANTPHTYDVPAALRTNAYTLTGWKFDGWATSASGTVAYLNKESVENLTTIDDDTVILYAKWTAITYQISYNSNKPSNASGSISGTMANTSHTYDTYAPLRTNAFTLTGWTFAGWATSPSGDIAYSNGQNLRNLTSTDNAIVPLYAKWTPITYTVSYNGNTHTGGSTASSTHTYDTYRNLTSNGFNKTGYSFLGWATSANGGVYYSNGQSVRNLSATNNATVTLYAKWERNNYKIFYNAMEGTIGADYKEVQYDTTVGTLSEPTWSGHDFLDWFTEPYGKGTKITSSTKYTYNEDITVYASWKYIITFNSNGGTTCHQMTGAYDAVISLPGTTKTGYTFSWYDTAGNWASSIAYTIKGDMKLTAQWSPISYVLTTGYSDNADGISGAHDHYYSSRSVSYDSVINLPAVKSFSGFTFQYWTITGNVHGTQYSQEPFTRDKFASMIVAPSSGNAITQVKNLASTTTYITLSAYYTKNSCVAEGTLITLADGSQKAVELLTGDEMLLVWNFQTGSFDFRPMLFNDNDALSNYEIIHLYFSDGTDIKIIDEHWFWNFDLNRYVPIKSDAAQYIGHWFNKQIVDANGELVWTEVKLIDVDIYSEQTTTWSPVTFGYLGYYVNGLLSLPGGAQGFTNIFDVDAETMQFNQEAYLADIAEYGMYTYEEFAEIFPIPEEIFEAFNAQYLKVSIGKGLIDLETIGALIELYGRFFG